MRLLIAATGVLLACAPATPASERTPSSVALAGVTVTPPSDTGWAMVAADRRHAIFERQGDSAAARLHAELVPDDSTAGDDAFLVAAEAQQNEALRAGGREMVSVHFYGTRLAGATCLQYDGIFRDPAAGESARAYRTVSGYLCRHPHTAGLAVRLHLEHDSGGRGSPDLEAILPVADAFYRSAVFTGGEEA